MVPSMSRSKQAILTIGPWIFITISFVLLLVVQLGGSSTTTLNNVYSMQIDAGTTEFYRIYLWSYCSGSFVDDAPVIDYCSPRTPAFTFNPQIIPSISSPDLLDDFRNDFTAYKSGTAWMWAAHLIALISIALTMASHAATYFTRYARYMTLFFAVVAELFATLATITSTTIFSQLSSAINNTFSSTSVTSSTSATMLALSWASTVLLTLGCVIYMFLALRSRKSSASGDSHDGNDNTQSRLPTAFANLSSSSLRHLKPITLADKLHCEKLSSIMHDKQTRRDSSFSFIDSAPRRPRDSFMSRISEHLSESSRPNSQSSFRSTNSSLRDPGIQSMTSSCTTLTPVSTRSNLATLDDVPITSRNSHLGTKVLVAAGQGRKSVVFAMDRNKVNTYNRPESQACSTTSDSEIQ